MRHLPTPMPPCAHVHLAAQAYAANGDAAFFDLFAALRVLLRVYALPLDRLEVLLDRVEAQPLPVEAMTVRQLVELVAAASPATAPAGASGQSPVEPHNTECTA